MSPELCTVLLSLVLFQVKHFLFDFPFQTQYQLQNKGIYGHPGGILHAGLHMLGSVPAMLVVSTQAGLIVALMVCEFLIHYHTDWTKERILKRYGWTPADYGFWQALGFDQMVHHLTYTGMLLTLLISQHAAY